MAPLPPRLLSEVQEVHAELGRRLAEAHVNLVLVVLGMAFGFVLVTGGLWLFQQHRKYVYYIQLEEVQKQRAEAAKAEEVKRLEVRREQMKEQVKTAMIKNQLPVEAQKRELAKREASDAARMQAREVREKMEATAVVREKKKAEQKAIEAQHAIEDAAAAEAYRQECLAAAMSRAEAAERMGKLQAKMAAQRLAEYRAKKEAEEAANALIGQRPDELGQHCDIKPPLPEGVFDPLPGSPRLSIPRLSREAQRASPSRRAWLPSTGWRSDRRGGESGTHWARSWMGADSPLSGRGTPPKTRSPGSPSSPQNVHNTYGYAHRLLGMGEPSSADAEEGEPAPITSSFSSFFGFGEAPASAPEGGELSEPGTPPKTSPEIGVRRAASRQGLNTPERRSAGASEPRKLAFGEELVAVVPPSPTPPAPPPPTPAPPQTTPAKKAKIASPKDGKNVHAKGKAKQKVSPAASSSALFSDPSPPPEDATSTSPPQDDAAPEEASEAVEDEEAGQQRKRGKKKKSSRKSPKKKSPEKERKGKK